MQLVQTLHLERASLYIFDTKDFSLYMHKAEANTQYPQLSHYPGHIPASFKVQTFGKIVYCLNECLLETLFFTFEITLERF